MYLEPDRADLWEGKTPRYVDRWRPIKDWKEEDVWAIHERWKVRAHPCYYLGWSRCSCKFCIFGNADQFASAFQISPSIGERMVGLEEEFGSTLKRNISLVDLVQKGSVYGAVNEELVDIATKYTYDLSIIMQNWELPAGAYGESYGPT